MMTMLAFMGIETISWIGTQTSGHRARKGERKPDSQINANGLCVCVHTNKWVAQYVSCDFICNLDSLSTCCLVPVGALREAGLSVLSGRGSSLHSIW